jgi:hypothetical protein
MSRPDRRRIVAMGGGGFSTAPGDPALDRYVLDVAHAPHPRRTCRCSGSAPSPWT